MRTLQGRTVLVTGASSGMGYAMARAFAARGARVVLSARRADALAELADRIDAEGHLPPFVVPADLSERGAAARLAASALAACGAVDVLVNNAGAALAGAQIAVGDDEPARSLFETNYWSPLALTRALAPEMKRRGIGAVVNVTSLVGIVPLPLGGHYCASKAALALATEVLRLELARTGVHVVHVVPGPVETPMLSEMARHQGAREILGRLPRGDADGIAAEVLGAIASRKGVVVYPRSLAIVRHAPTLVMALAGRQRARARKA